MKKIIIAILISGILFGSIGVLVATYLYHANEVSYTPSDSNFNVDNVDDAINELYANYNNIIVKETLSVVVQGGASYGYLHNFETNKFLSGDNINGEYIKLVFFRQQDILFMLK